MNCLSLFDHFVELVFEWLSKKILIVKKICLLGHMVNLRAVYPQIMKPYVSWSALKVFLLEDFRMMVHKRNILYKSNFD